MNLLTKIKSLFGIKPVPKAPQGRSRLSDIEAPAAPATMDEVMDMLVNYINGLITTTPENLDAWLNRARIMPFELELTTHGLAVSHYDKSIHSGHVLISFDTLEAKFGIMKVNVEAARLLETDVLRVLHLAHANREKVESLDLPKDFDFSMDT